MRVAELIKRLQEFDSSLEVVAYSDFGNNAVREVRQVRAWDAGAGLWGRYTIYEPEAAPSESNCQIMLLE